MQCSLKWVALHELAVCEKSQDKKKEKNVGDENIELSSASSPGLHRENLCKVHSSKRGESLIRGVFQSLFITEAQKQRLAEAC